MLLQQSFRNDFLAETNFVFTQDDYGNQMYDILQPIKNYFLNQQEILPFSIVKFLGADTRLAFWCEWYFHTYKLRVDTSDLVEENRAFLRKRIPIKYRTIEHIYEIVDQDIEKVILPSQQMFLVQKGNEMSLDLARKFPAFQKYFTPVYLSRINSAEFQTIRYLYETKFDLHTIAEAQMYRSSFLLLGLPLILGFSYLFHEPDTIFNAKAVNWSKLEELIRQVVFLHETGRSMDYVLQMQFERLKENERMQWIALDRSQKLAELKEQPEIIESFKQERQGIYKKSKAEIEEMLFPEHFKEILFDLTEWSYALMQS